MAVRCGVRLLYSQTTCAEGALGILKDLVRERQLRKRIAPRAIGARAIEVSAKDGAYRRVESGERTKPCLKYAQEVLPLVVKEAACCTRVKVAKGSPGRLCPCLDTLCRRNAAALDSKRLPKAPIEAKGQQDDAINTPAHPQPREYLEHTPGALCSTSAQGV